MTDTHNNEDSGKLLYCSLCDKSQREVCRLITGPSVFIRDECVGLCNDIIREEVQEAQAESSGHKLPAPKEIRTIPDQYVIGQERAKKILAVAVYNHCKHLNQRDKKNNIELDKSNILMIGPAGSSKALLVEAPACLLNMSFTIADAIMLMGAGYVGEDIESIIQELLQKCDYDVEEAQMGIVYIDEIDKTSRKSDNPSVTRDVSSRGMQQTLLRLIEGTAASVPSQGGREYPQQEFPQVGTRNILFIRGGAFAGLERVIQNRFTRGGIDPNAEVRNQEVGKRVSEALKGVEPENLVKLGLIPESVGRLPVIATLDKLDEAAPVQILTEPKNILIKQYVRLFEMEGADFEFHPDVFKVVTCKTLERKTGTCGLRSILEDTFLDTMYEIPSQQDVNEVAIDESVTDGPSQPLVIYENGRKPVRAVPEV